MYPFVAVWIDHHEARVFQLHPDAVDESTVVAPPFQVHHRRPKGAEGPKARVEEDRVFFQEVARSLEGAGEILIVGPSTAKLGLLRYLRTHAEHTLEPRVVGVETVDHPTDRQLVVFVKKCFRHSDAMLK
jgi:hypothetical protein